MKNIQFVETCVVFGDHLCRYKCSNALLEAIPTWVMGCNKPHQRFGIFETWWGLYSRIGKVDKQASKRPLWFAIACLSTLPITWTVPWFTIINQSEPPMNGHSPRPTKSFVVHYWTIMNHHPMALKPLFSIT